jgi:hypothetical protein
MSNFKPSFTISADSDNKYMFDGKTYKDFVFPTYAELKSKLKGIMKEYRVSEVTVSRSRRGEWGEWFEYWHLSGNKLTKGKEGWM